MSFVRRTTCNVQIGSQWCGSDHPVLVQSMTNTPTEDVRSTVEQIQELRAAGSEIVRLTVNNAAAAEAVPHIVRELERRRIDMPLAGDFHYNGHLLLTQFKDCAHLLAKYRINPGNVGAGNKHDLNFRQMIEVAIRHDKPVRIGVNWGSLDQDLFTGLMDQNARLPQPQDSHAVLIEAVLQSALHSAVQAEAYGLRHDCIVLSAKVSDVQDLVAIYRQLAQRCNYPLHLGLTEAGMAVRGVVASTAALAILLAEGIGDTIRASLTPAPGSSRTEEVLVCRHILQSMGIRSFAPQISACPGCGRTTSSVYQELAAQIEEHIARRRQEWKDKYLGVEKLKIAVMGCIVNGPGESKHADIGISLPGTGEEPRAPVFIDGEYATTLEGPRLAHDFLNLLDQYVGERFAKEPIERCTTNPVA